MSRRTSGRKFASMYAKGHVGIPANLATIAMATLAISQSKRHQPSMHANVNAVAAALVRQRTLK